MASVSRRAGGDHRARSARRSSGAPSGSSQPGKLTWPPASRTISWPAAASTPRERRSETIPSKRAAATWHSDDGDRAERAQAVGAVCERVDRRRDPARVGGLDPEHLEPAVARRGARAGSGRGGPRRARRRRRATPTTARAARSRARRRRPRRPSSRRRRPRSTARSGDAALGVQRAVDRVDDHAHAGVAVVDLAALLGHARGTGSPRRAGVELVEHELLGGRGRSRACGRRRCRGCRSPSARSSVVGTSASMRSRPATARRQTPSQSASSAERVEVIADLCCQTWRSP